MQSLSENRRFFRDDDESNMDANVLFDLERSVSGHPSTVRCMPTGGEC